MAITKDKLLKIFDGLHKDIALLAEAKALEILNSNRTLIEAEAAKHGYKPKN
jgi:hypothetical protein